MEPIQVQITNFGTCGDHTEYALQIAFQGKSWTVSRRFKHFEDLHALLQVKRSGIAELPGKQWFGRFKQDFLVRRQRQLQQYLDTLLRSEQIRASTAMAQFLEISSQAPSSSGEAGAGGGAGADIEGSGMGVEGGSVGQGSAASGSDTTDAQAMREGERLRQVIRKLEHNFIDVLQRDPVDSHACSERSAEILDRCNSFAEVDLSAAAALPSLPAPPPGGAQLQWLVDRTETAENYGPLLDRCLEQLHQGMQARNDAIAEPKGLVGGIAVMAAGSS